MIETAGGGWVILLRFIALTALTGTLGAWAFGRLVVERLGAEDGSEHRASLRFYSVRFAGWAVALFALSAFVRLLSQAGAGTEGGIGVTGTALLQSTAGRLLVLQGVVATVAAALFLTRRAAQSWPLGGDVCLAGLLLLQPWQAHAGTAMELRTVAIAVDVIHLAAAAGWVGALAILTISIALMRSASDAPVRTAALMIAFHPIAVVAAPAVFVTGLLTAWLRMGVPEGIATPAYSGLFVAKLLLVGVTGFIGAGHSKLAMRRVAALNPNDVRRSLFAECAFALLVLVVTAVLVGTPPIG